jgi:hypothetical protein
LQQRHSPLDCYLALLPTSKHASAGQRVLPVNDVFGLLERAKDATPRVLFVGPCRNQLLDYVIRVFAGGFVVGLEVMVCRDRELSEVGIKGLGIDQRGDSLGPLCSRVVAHERYKRFLYGGK